MTPRSSGENQILKTQLKPVQVTTPSVLCKKTICRAPIALQSDDNKQNCSIDELNALDISKNYFLIIHVNIRSLQKNLCKLHELLYDLKFSPDLIAVSETWHVTTSFFIPNIPGYKLVCSSSACNRAGGVAIFIKDYYEFSIRHDVTLNCDRCESLFIEVKDKLKKHK